MKQIVSFALKQQLCCYSFRMKRIASFGLKEMLCRHPLCMKRMLLFGILISFFCYPLNAAEMDLRIQTPDTKLILQPVSPPQHQRDGLPLYEESPTIHNYFQYINAGDYEEALSYLREEEGALLELIESGDPDGELKKRAVVGGTSPTMGTGKISAYLLYLIGHAYSSAEKHQAAETAFLAALTAIPDYLSVHESLGILYFRTERYKEAHKHLVRAAGLGLHTAQLFGALGYLNSQLGNYWGAVNAYQEALMLDPDFEQCKRNLLQVLNRTSQYQSALTLVESMLQAHPDDAGLWLFRGSSALQAGERGIALSSLETAIRLGDRRVSNFQVGAVLHMEMGSVERAVDLLKIGFDEGMDFTLFDQGMGWLMGADEWVLLEQLLASARGKWNDLEDLQQSKVLMREADVSLHKGDKSAASKALAQALTLDPSNAYAMMSLADIYREADKYSHAESLYQRASADELYRENALISLTQMAMDEEDFEHALRILRDIQKEFPHRIDLNRNIESLENIILMEDDS